MNKPKKCRICKSEFDPFSSTQVVCSPPCAIELNERKKKEKARKEYDRVTRELKEKTKTRAQWLKEAQAVFNEYVRLRDAEEPCISCNRHHQGQYHAGHYLSVGASPELRFHPFNNNKQCAPCNNHLSGNIARYRPRLIEKIGLDAVEWLEGPHEPQKWTVFDIKEIKQYYKELIKELKNEQD